MEALGHAHRSFQAGTAAAGLLVIVMALLWGSGQSPFSPPEPATEAVSTKPLPLSFVHNEGQVDPAVRFYAQGPGHAVYFTRDKAVLSFTKGERGVALQLTPLGANPRATLEAGHPAPGKVNYLSGRDHHTNLATYREVTYHDLWPGIDMSFRGAPGTLKYEFHVRPGGDPSDIQLAYRGADGLSLGAAGNLLIHTSLGTLRDARPRSYQVVNGERVPVGSSYAVRGGNGYGIHVAGHDARRPLVIDPGLVLSTFLGGTAGETGEAIAVDGAGSIYVGGYSSSPDFPTTPGAFDTSPPALRTDSFVTKLNAAGTALVYSTYIGGASENSGEDPYVHGIAVDSSGSAYIVGDTGEADFPVTPGAYDTSRAARDAFVAKLNPTGSALVYATYLGGTANDEGRSIAVDSAGSAYVTGWSPWPSGFPGFPTDTGGAYATKLDPSGSSLVYSEYLGEAEGNGIAVSGTDAFITGYVWAAPGLQTTPGAYDTTQGGSSDAFVVRLGSGGAKLYSTYLGGDSGPWGSGDSGTEIAADAAGNAYVFGWTTSTLFPTTPGAFDTTLANSTDLFVTKVNPAGNGLVYSTYLGSGGTEGGALGGIAVDSTGSAYVTSPTNSENYPKTVAGSSPPFAQPPADGRSNIAVSRLNPSGTALVFSGTIGGPNDLGTDVAVGTTGNAYVTGTTRGLPTTAGAYDTTYGGNGDAFVLKIDASASAGYPRPKGATPLRASLVPAYQQCTAPNKTHGPPLAFGSCGAPAKASGYATVGTPDANGKTPAGVGFLKLSAIAGDPGTPADESDVSLEATMSDVRSDPGLTDYAGELRARLRMRVTDRFDAATKSDPATVMDLEFGFTIPCTPTTDPPDVGATCSVATSADAVAPGAAPEGMRSIWALEQVEVSDGGADADGDSTGDNTPFLRQGVFVP